MRFASLVDRDWELPQKASSECYDVAGRFNSNYHSKTSAAPKKLAPLLMAPLLTAIIFEISDSYAPFDVSHDTLYRSLFAAVLQAHRNFAFDNGTREGNRHSRSASYHTQYM